VGHGATTIKLRIKVVPGASRNRVAGWLGEMLKVQVSAPPEQGRANAAVEATISDALCVPAACVRIVAGHTSARKTIEIVGLSEDEARRRLSTHLE
jgi:uncharacterized protein (TIGR00251 family)